MDITLSNLPATILAMIVLRVCGLELYDWFGSEGAKSIKDWKVFHCHKRFGSLCMLFIGVSSSFLSGFFMINGLWIPPICPLNVYRLCTWFLLCNLTFREGYTDVKTWNTLERENLFISGKTRFITSGILLLEAIVSWKFNQDADNINYVSTPWYIWLPWLILATICLSFYLYLRLKKNATTKYPYKIKKKRL